MKKPSVARPEWEYASLTTSGARPVSIEYDKDSEANMRADAVEVLERVAGGTVGLIELLNALGEEGWEVTSTLPQANAENVLILKRPGVRREIKDATLNAEVIKTLEALGL
jgi:hypothetical protein